MRLSTPEINVGLIGYGGIGTGVVTWFQEGGGKQLGLNLKRVAVADLSKPRRFQLPNLTDDALSIVKDSSIDIVVELMGGMYPARDFMFDAIDKGKSVVTGNKKVLARCMGELFKATTNHAVDLGFEAAVAGSIPIIEVINNSRGIQAITRVDAIINGTTNFILTQMEEGLDYKEALKQAQNLGFAEADPTEDVEGIDAQNKLAVTAALVWNAQPNLEAIYVKGITQITSRDIMNARKQGQVIKLVASAVKESQDQVALCVAPTALERDHVLASVKGAFNAAYYVGDWSGPQFMMGKGAGERPTTSAVIKDIIHIARNRRTGVPDDLPTLDSAIRFTSPARTLGV